MMAIELVLVDATHRADDDDWYIHVAGVSRGYLYRVAGGYAVGIDVNGEVKHHSIEPNKAAALSFAERHI